MMNKQNSVENNLNICLLWYHNNSFKLCQSTFFDMQELARKGYLLSLNTHTHTVYNVTNCNLIGPMTISLLSSFSPTLLSLYKRKRSCHNNALWERESRCWNDPFSCWIIAQTPLHLPPRFLANPPHNSLLLLAVAGPIHLPRAKH